MKIFGNIITILLLWTASIHCQVSTISINKDSSYQTIMGWGCSAAIPEYADKQLLDETAKTLVHDLGINRLRLDYFSGNRAYNSAWESENDNGDPEYTDYKLYNTKALSDYLNRFLVAFKNETEKRGVPFNLTIRPGYFNAGSSGPIPVWLYYSPGEYAELALSKILFLRDSLNINTDFFTIINEPSNNNSFNLKKVSEVIKVLGPKLKQHGLSTKIQFPETSSPSGAWNYLLQSEFDEEMWQYVGLISYHLYGYTNPYLKNISTFAKYKEIPTAQSEYVFLNTDVLYNDLVNAEISYWDLFAISSVLDWKINRTSKLSNFWNFRQIIKYAPPGSVRIHSESDDSLIKTLAFKYGDDISLVIINKNDSIDVNVKNLPSGRYGISYTQSGSYSEIGIHNANSNLQFKLPKNSIATVYKYNGENLKPIISEIKPEREFLPSTDSSMMVYVLASDPELDSLQFRWSITEKPIGSNPNIISPENPVTSISDMNQLGTYIIKAAVNDGIDTVEGFLRIQKFAENQKPILFDVHSRNPVKITLPTDSVELRAGAWDIETDTITYQWTIISTPSGAEPTISCSMTNRCKVKNMSIPGDYTFLFTASDKYGSSSQILTVPVYPVNNPPIIVYINASEYTISEDVAVVGLEARTYDLDADTITHWWSIEQAPFGAKPVFSSQGAKSTAVTNLTIPGEYLFSIYAIDRTLFAYDTVRVTVEKSTGIIQSDKSLAYLSPEFENISPNPFDKHTSIEFNLAQDENLEIYILNSNGVKVRNFGSNYYHSGANIIIWDGNDDSGNPCPTSVYLCIIKSRSRVKSINLLKIAH